VTDSFRTLNILGINSTLIDQAKSEIRDQTSVSHDDISHSGIPQHDIPKKSGVNILSNFCKVDQDVFDKVIISMNVYEQSVYMRLYRLSFGYNRNWCVASYGEISKSCAIGRTMVVETIKSLISKGWLKPISFDRSKGTTYRIYLPVENGIESKTKIKFSVSQEDIPQSDIPHDDIPQYDTCVSHNGISSGNTQGKSLKIKDPQSISQDDIPQNDIHLKDRSNIKDHSLSKEDKINNVIDSFYGSVKLPKSKRESARKVILELQEDGFTLDDISYAVQWSFDNCKEKPYDFSIVRHTIGQSMATKKENEAKTAKKLEEERLKTQQEEKEKKLAEVQERIIEHKEKLNESQKSELREKALEEIRKTKGIREEFITEILIEAKENEIIRKQLGMDVPE